MLQHRTLSSVIKRHRLIEGYTQEQLADRVGVSKSQISRIENGLLIPKASSIARIAESLCVDEQYLLMSAVFTVLNQSPVTKCENLSGIMIALKTKQG